LAKKDRLLSTGNDAQHLRVTADRRNGAVAIVRTALMQPCGDNQSGVLFLGPLAPANCDR
jgi:hypothetical protein